MIFAILFVLPLFVLANIDNAVDSLMAQMDVRMNSLIKESSEHLSQKIYGNDSFTPMIEETLFPLKEDILAQYELITYHILRSSKESAKVDHLDKRSNFISNVKTTVKNVISKLEQSWKWILEKIYSIKIKETIQGLFKKSPKAETAAAEKVSSTFMKEFYGFFSLKSVKVVSAVLALPLIFYIIYDIVNPKPKNAQADLDNFDFDNLKF